MIDRNAPILLTVALLCSVATVSNPRQAIAQQKAELGQQPSEQQQFILPQENKICEADSQDLGGFAYGPVRLGMSFKKWKQAQEELGFVDAIQKISKTSDKNPNTAVYKMTKPPMDIWGHHWGESPIFSFIDDNGVYRLYAINGAFSNSDASGVLKQLSAEYGEPVKDPHGALIWTIANGSTRILIAVTPDGALSVQIYDRVLYHKWLDQILQKAAPSQ